MKKPKILCFAGSLRKDSFNKKLLHIASQGAKEEGADITVIDLEDYPLPIYNQEDEDKNGLPENALALKNLMKEHQGLLIASPEYNSSISGALKNTIDWISRPHPSDKVYLEPFIDKVAVLMSASPGNLGGLRGLVHLRSILGNIHVIVLPDQLAIPNAGEAFLDDGSLKDSKKQESAKKMGKKLAEFLNKLEL